MTQVNDQTNDPELDLNFNIDLSLPTNDSSNGTIGTNDGQPTGVGFQNSVIMPLDEQQQITDTSSNNDIDSLPINEFKFNREVSDLGDMLIEKNIEISGNENEEVIIPQSFDFNLEESDKETITTQPVNEIISTDNSQINEPIISSIPQVQELQDQEPIVQPMNIDLSNISETEITTESNTTDTTATIDTGIYNTNTEITETENKIATEAITETETPTVTETAPIQESTSFDLGDLDEKPTNTIQTEQLEMLKSNSPSTTLNLDMLENKVNNIEKDNVKQELTTISTSNNISSPTQTKNVKKKSGGGSFAFFVVIILLMVLGGAVWFVLNNMYSFEDGTFKSFSLNKNTSSDESDHGTATTFGKSKTVAVTTGKDDKSTDSLENQSDEDTGNTDVTTNSEELDTSVTTGDDTKTLKDNAESKTTDEDSTKTNDTKKGTDKETTMTSDNTDSIDTKDSSPDSSDTDNTSKTTSKVKTDDTSDSTDIANSDNKSTKKVSETIAVKEDPSSAYDTRIKSIESKIDELADQGKKVTLPKSILEKLKKDIENGNNLDKIQANLTKLEKYLDKMAGK